jgi:hypothetical protein
MEKESIEANGNSSKVYGAHKVSEFTHGKGRYVVDEPEIEERKKQKD